MEITCVLIFWVYLEKKKNLFEFRLRYDLSKRRAKQGTYGMNYVFR